MDIENKFPKKDLQSNKDLVLVASILSPHGIRGNVKLFVYTEQVCDFFSFKEVIDENGNIYSISPLSEKKNFIIVNIKGIVNRNEANMLVGKNLYVLRSELPTNNNLETYYHIDLIGLKVVDNLKNIIGKVKSVQNYGAGDILVVEDKKRGYEEYFLFTKRNFPFIDLKNGIISYVES